MTTKGSSQFSPTRYEKDAIIQTWVDRRDLANIALYMKTAGNTPKHLSDVTRFAIETVSEMIKRGGGVIFEKTGEAVTFLSENFDTDLNPNKKGRKNLMNNLLMDSGYVPGDFRVSDITHPRPDVHETHEIPEVEEGPYSELDIAEMKRNALAQFSGLKQERREKDSSIAEEEKKAFDAMVKK